MDTNSSDREFLLDALARFIREVRSVPGVVRIAVIGSLTTNKRSPKDADVLLTVEDDVDIARLAALGRKLKGRAQARNHGADIFLADTRGAYIGRTCGFRECLPRAACRGRSCHLGTWLCDDFEVMRLADAVIAEPPVEVWPNVVVRTDLPSDTRAVLLGDGRQHEVNEGAV